jgi:hypothetical protein
MTAIAGVATMFAAIRSDGVARTPSAIVVAIRLVIPADVTHANAADTDAIDCATR